MAKYIPATLLDLVLHRAKEQPEEDVYRFISRDTDDLIRTCSDLDRKARAIAAHLLSINAGGQRALLLYLPGLHYIEAFWGCLYAGVVAVPAYPPDPQRLARTLPRLNNIIQDSKSYVIMSTSFIEGMAKDLLIDQEQKDISWLSTDQIPDEKADSWVKPKITPETLAFLQYTSGSTSNPRGVMLSHKNLISNLALIDKELPAVKNPVGVSWLPPYHDMGLIGGFLYPMFGNFKAVLMSPLDFLIEPLVWLKALSKYKGTISAGPNFAYDLCVKRITPEQRDQLDLSSWRTTANGAEPIRAETMVKFSEYFKSCGFNKSTFFPCYGLAETALYVCGKTSTEFWTTVDVDGHALEKGKITPAKANQPSRSIVSSGRALHDQEILIVDKKTRKQLPDNCVGEIWLKHPSVSQGYFGQTEKNKETFQAYLSNKKGPYLRTGDLGFFRDKELYITGRQKDVIIIRGRNHYPQDIEKTVEESNENIRFGCIAAISLDVAGKEELGLVIEIKNKDLASETIEAVKRAVSLEHGLNVYTIALVEAKSIAKTSSGKIQRHASKEMLHNNTLDLIELWQAKQKNKDKPKKEVKVHKAEPTDKLHAVKNAVITVLGLDASKEFDFAEPLVAYGLDSLMRQELIGALEKITKKPLNNLIIDEDTTTELLVEKLKAFSAQISLTKEKKTAKKSEKDIPSKYTRFDEFPAYVAMQEQLSTLKAAGLKNPFFAKHEGLVQDTTTVNGSTLINFSNYNYVGMAGNKEVSKAAKEAIDTYGTSVSASRLVSGDRPLHAKLERKIADWIGVDDSIVYVSGHATNVSTIGHLFEEGDLIVHDSLSHNSIQMGCRLSRAKAIPFAHNDPESLDRILALNRSQYKRALVVIEGIYSMDGDIPDLEKYIEIKNRHRAFLMVDEAHSIGVLGKNGKGLAEHAGVDPKDVDLWMGTLSKAFASCGGYIAGCKEIIDFLRYSSPAFVYSVGLSPPNAAASLRAIEILEKEPDRIKKLSDNSNLFLKLCKENKLDTGLSKDSPIVPIIIGNSLQSLLISEKLLQAGVNAMPIIYPAVEDHMARLRFFITSCHNEDQIRQTVKALTKEVAACTSS